MTDNAADDSSAARDMVTLRNGDSVPELMVKVLLISLSTLIQKYPIPLYELVMSCRDHEHVLFPDTPEVLTRLNLIESLDEKGRARIHDLTRSIVVSAIEGEDFEMRLVNPIAS